MLGFRIGSGVTVAISTQPRWKKSVAFTIVFRCAWRAVWLILMGYALHFPFLSFSENYLSGNVSPMEGVPFLRYVIMCGWDFACVWLFFFNSY